MSSSIIKRDDIRAVAVVMEEVTTVSGGAVNTIGGIASCPDGYICVAGGYYYSGTPQAGLHVFLDAPQAAIDDVSTEGWRVSGIVDDGYSGPDLQVFAVCMKI